MKLPQEAQIIYNKIIFGERLSGKEKDSQMFKLLHSFWTQIKEEKLQAAAQALVLQAREMAQAENDEQEPEDIDKDYTPVKRAKEENEV